MPPRTPQSNGTALVPTNESNAVNTLRLPEPLLEELNVVRLEGRYFCFDRHEAKQRTGVLKYRDGSRLLKYSPASVYR